MILQNIFSSLINYILPYRCIACSQITEDNLGICTKCFKDLNFISAPYCIKCGFPFEFTIQDQSTCGKCIVKPSSIDIARSLFKFDFKSKKLIHGFKYNDRTASAGIFAKIILARYKKDFEDIDIVVPVPMHRIKRIFRQYNPAQILAREISERLERKMMPEILIKSKLTKSQTKLTKIQRGKNLSGSIIFNRSRNIAGKNILLVDDVKTTGTTSNTCADILKKHGAAQVKLITIGAT